MFPPDYPIKGIRFFDMSFPTFSVKGSIPGVISTPPSRTLNYNFLALIDPATAAFHMAKPSQAPFCNNIAQFRYAQFFTNSCTAYSFIWSNSTHASEHAPFIPLESVNLSLSGGPCFTAVKHGTAYASVIDPAFSPQCNIFATKDGL